MEKLLPTEVTIFPEKLVRKSYQGSKRLNKVDKFARIQS